MLAPVVRRWRVWRGRLSWTLRLVVMLVPELVVDGAAGGGVGGGAWMSAA